MQFKNLSFIAILLAVYSCSNSKGGQTGMAGQVREYNVVSLQPQDITLYKDYPTTLQGSQTVEIRPRVAGYIEEIMVDEGDLVKKGQVLFRLNANDLQAQVRSAEAQVKVAEAQVSTAKINVDKTQPLVDKNIISEFELESAKTALASAEAQLANANANVANAKANLGYTLITSPTNGIIGNFPYRVGSLVSSTITQPLTTVSNTANMYAYFSMNETEFLTMTQDLEGASTKQKLENLPAVDLVLPTSAIYANKGKVETASGIVDQTTGAINIRASFYNPEGVLRSGSSGAVRIPQHYTNAIIIPQKATVEIQNKHFAYTVNEENKVVNTLIEVVTGNLKDSYIVTSGLKAGDKVVLEGISSLRDGTEIKPKVETQQAIDSNSSNQ
ncbi:membrane fusion protein (multidrug efflux system) [Mangrovibacterium diazotrophicum]|uniref:Membrane fusion protein (Multidrug efflux system) n=2 Tax=Mangrovibacterium diazotrophicum TaxID=1261403 RepID=A0A419WBX8_9BACT|nr:membrane fusion protein (multidrug efflux system) [Mangrovibacterium diazotrophicum]